MTGLGDNDVYWPPLPFKRHSSEEKTDVAGFGGARGEVAAKGGFVGENLLYNNNGTL